MKLRGGDFGLGDGGGDGTVAKKTESPKMILSVNGIKGQWPYRAATIKNNHVMYNFHYCGIYCCLPKTVILVASEAMVTSKQPQWLLNSNLTSDLMQATSITLASMCILPRIAIMVASEAIAASKWPLRP